MQERQNIPFEKGDLMGTEATLWLPEFHAPFPTRFNPAEHQAEQHAREFVDAFGLTPTAEDRVRYASYAMGTFMAGIFPDAEPDDLITVTDWMGLWFLIDDHVERAEAGRLSPMEIMDFGAEILTIFTPDASVQPSGTSVGRSPFSKAYVDVWQQIAARMSVWWRCRFAAHMAAWFAAEALHCQARLDRKGPCIEQVIAVRRLSSGFLPTLDMAEFTFRSELPAPLVNAIEFTQVRQHCNDSLIWINDIVSAPKEDQAGDIFNLVLCVERRDQCNRAKAYRRVSRMSAARLEEYIAACDRVPALYACLGLTPNQEATGNIYLASMENMYAGHLAWAQRSGRYQ